MSAPMELTEDMIQDFESLYGITIRDLFESSIHGGFESCNLSDNQIETVLRRCEKTDPSRDVLDLLHPTQPSVSLSLYVINDATWRLMGKKETHSDRMLPMVTIPWFYWDEASRDKSGAVRYKETICNIQLDPDRLLLSAKGEGGDFCGIVSRSALKKSFSPWRVLIPEIPDSDSRSPNYEWARISLKVKYKDASCTLHPHPRKDLDYTYSESPKVFYDNGIEIATQGENVRLKVGKRPETSLAGNVLVLIGRPSKGVSDLGSVLGYHLWIHALYNRMSNP